MRACLYPPNGYRGLAFGVTRHSAYGADSADTWAKANSEVFIMLQIETPKAVEAIPAMAKVPGFDAFLIGPNDLMSNLKREPAEALACLPEAADQGRGLDQGGRQEARVDPAQRPRLPTALRARLRHDLPRL